MESESEPQQHGSVESENGTSRQTVNTTILMSRGDSKGSGPVCSTHANATRRLLKRRCARSSSRLFVGKHRLNGNSRKRNSTVSPLLSLPPEIRNRIYDLVLGGQMLWISYNFHERHDIIKGRLKKIHTGFKLDQKVQIGFLRVCRQIYGEAALLPYALNKFIFRTDCVRRKFEKITRPAQKRAVGKYEIGYYTGSSKLKKSIISSTSNVPRPPPTHAMRVKDRVSCEESISKTSNIPRPPSYAEWVKNH